MSEEELMKMSLEELIGVIKALKYENQLAKENLKNIHNEYINYMDKQDFAKKCKISRPYLDKLLKTMNREEIYDFCVKRNKILGKDSDKE